MINLHEVFNRLTKRRERIRHLLKPLDTVLDDSIGCAIWFAAEGQGHIRTYDDDDTPLSYSSPARVGRFCDKPPLFQALVFSDIVF